MNRKEFIKTCSALGIGAWMFPSLLTGCSSEEDAFPEFEVNFAGKVLIVGAGAAGITAGYVLSQYGIDFEIIEAAPVYGGRVKEAVNFADFPIDLGAEWIHTDATILPVLINDPEVDASIDLINYSPESLYVWNNNKLKKRNFFTNFYGELKFKSTTWYSFFDNYMIPAVRNKLTLNSPVSHIDYSSDKVSITNTNNEVFEGDRLILTVPLTILKQNSINFNPPLPDRKINALNEIEMPDGIKVFMEFSERFYPDLTYDGGLSAILNETDGEKIYYDAAFGKDTNKNILGLFTVGKPASQYTDIATDAELIQYILNELDQMFDGKATPNYVKHVTQNWTNEPYIGGSYTHGDNSSASPVLKEPIDGKIYFAGETYAPEDYATVHGAAQSAFVAVEEILKG
ncbi:MAG: FAD-dependent oxidoreductase [Roseivirga sp.]|nr:FAD-dependent oxidoreductase [Roseivirga sp.]